MLLFVACALFLCSGEHRSPIICFLRWFVIELDTVIAAGAAAAGRVHAAVVDYTRVGLLQAFNVPLKDSEVIGHLL